MYHQCSPLPHIHAIFFSPFKRSQGKYVFIARFSCNRQYCLDHHIECLLKFAGSKVQVTFHWSRVQVTAPSINYQTTQFLLELIKHLVKRLGLGDTFSAVFFYLYHSHLYSDLWKMTCILAQPLKTNLLTQWNGRQFQLSI